MATKPKSLAATHAKDGLPKRRLAGAAGARTKRMRPTLRRGKIAG